MDVAGNSFPRSLADWRSQAEAWSNARKYEPYDLWRPLIPFFESRGLTLWETSARYPEPAYNLLQPKGIERTPDGFSYLSEYFSDGLPGLEYHIQQVNPIVCPARTSDGRDVMIRLVCMKTDPSPSGIRHLEILRRIAKGHVACIGNNHIVPVLQELTSDEHGLTFIVQPKLFDIDAFPTWYTAREAADFVVQILEGFDFCHRRFIAHLDIGYGNLLSNFRGGAKFPADYTRGKAYPFRSHFPVRYYLNDFELRLSFDENSDPSSRLIMGIPYTASGRPGTYGRPLAPEMTKPDVRYCPFRADVWQLGTLMKKDCEFENVGGLPEYQSLLDEMVAEDPFARPTMSEALRRARELRLTLPEDL